MANIFTSSIGKKLIMSISGLFLILFLFIHAFVNALSLISDEAFQAGCEFMSLPIVTVMVPVLAAGFIIHIVYAFILNAMNLKARGPQRYAVANKAKTDDWASKNMLVLGIIVVLGLLLHLFNFWYNMMFAELLGTSFSHDPADGFAFIQDTFANPVYVVLYIIWLVALWFHLTHGFWSALQTLGWNGKTWFCRWKTIGIVYVTVLIALFIVVVLAFAAGVAPSLCCCAA